MREKDADITHAETASAVEHHAKWKVSKAGDGDVAMALFKSPDDIHEPIDPAEEARVVRKIDLMSKRDRCSYGVGYSMADAVHCRQYCRTWRCATPSSTSIRRHCLTQRKRTAMSNECRPVANAATHTLSIFGIRKDLDLVGQEYSVRLAGSCRREHVRRLTPFEKWLSSIFYFGFLAWALPTNLLMQRLPIGKYLGFNIFLWGVFLMIQSAARNFAGLAALRAFAGAAEACSDPSFMLITSMWYTRRQQPIRMGIWYTANGFGIALGGLLGFGIGHIKGALPSWKFEFLIIGALCCIWGVVMFIFLPDSPITAKGLTQREKRIAVERLRDNQTGVENKVSSVWLLGRMSLQ